MVNNPQQRINEVILSIGGEILGEIVTATEGIFYLRIAISNAPNQGPTRAAILKARKLLEEEGISVSFMFYDEVTKNIEQGLQTTLLVAFNDHIRNAFLATNKNKVDVWFEQKNAHLDDNVFLEIQEKTRIYLENINLELNTISSLNSVNIPSKTAILNAIRILSPATLESLMQFLRNKEFAVPSENWILRRLDSLRKAKQVLRLKDGSYALTFQTLRVLGSSVSRNSPDIQRFLALARR